MPRLKINLEAIERDCNANAEGFSADGGVRVGSLLVSSEGVRDSAGHSYVLCLNDFDVVPEAEGGFLGRGSSGSVRRAIHRRSGTVVALKEIKVTGKAHMSEIRRELETLHAGDSATPYLVNFYGAFTHEGSVFIAMEAMDGSLLEIAKPVPLPVLACMTRQILKGLFYLHRARHLMHRDLKPSNVLYNSRTGDIKISDFGVSSFLECTKADAHSFVGTVTYMSPERLHGDSYSYGADIWSLGLVVAELALGQCPFAGLRGESSEGRFWALIQHLNSPGPALELPAEMDSTLADFINACVVKAPDQRATAAELMTHPFLKKFTTSAATGAEALVRRTAQRTPPPPPLPAAASAPVSSTTSSSSPLLRGFPVTQAWEGGPSGETAQRPLGHRLASPATSSPSTSSPQERPEGECEEDAADHATIQRWLHAVAEEAQEGQAARQRQQRRRRHGQGPRRAQANSTVELAGGSGRGVDGGTGMSGGTGGSSRYGSGSGPSTLNSNDGGEQASSQGEESVEKSHGHYSGDSGSARNSRDVTMTGQHPTFGSHNTGGEPSVNLDDELNKLLF